LSEPARDYDARAAAKDELDAILREAEAVRRSGGPANDFVDDHELPAPTAPVLVEPGAAEEASTSGAAKPRDGVRFDRFEIKVPEAGPNRLPAYRINSFLPLAGVLGAIAFLLWMLVPGGIQFLRPQAVPDAYVDASARWTLALTRQRIDRFEDTQGRLPQSLEELDPNLSEVVSYQGLPEGGYVLRAAGHREMFTLESSASPERFLGGGAELLRRGPAVTR
jgi:hypothetical protein